MSRIRALNKALFTQTKFSKVKRIYFRKSIYYGSYIEHYDYHKLQISYSHDRAEFRRTKGGDKSDYSVARARERIFRLVEANVGKHGKFKPVFFTLTTEDQITNIKESNRKIKAFIRRLSKHSGHKIKYIIVPERHVSKAIHYHGIFFNLPYTDVKYFRHSIWGHGYVDLQLPRKIRSVASYIAKYLTEDTKQNLQRCDKSFFCSRGLYKPIELYDSESIHDTVYLERTVQLKKALKLIYKKCTKRYLSRLSSSITKQVNQKAEKITIF